MITTTHQNTIFPLHQYTSSKEGLSVDDFATQLREQFFKIEDDLLYKLITYGDGLQQRPADIKGFTWSKGAGYGVLAFLVSRAMDLYRLPFTPDRIYGSLPFGERESQSIKHLLSELKPNRVEKITEEVRALYAHTQKMLANAGLDEVVLTRRIYDDESDTWRRMPNYATQLVRRKQIALHHQHKTIKFEMDTLNSFGDDGGYSHYPVTLEFKVPASDVLYCANLIASRNTNYEAQWIDHKHAVEPGEWVVINRAPDGIVELPINQVHVNHRLFEDRFKATPDWLDAQKIDDAPIVLRQAAHLQDDNRYWGYGFTPKWPQRMNGALSGMIQGALRGYRQGWFR